MKPTKHSKRIANKRIRKDLGNPNILRFNQWVQKLAFMRMTAAAGFKENAKPI